jgi:hypothetical protein
MKLWQRVGQGFHAVRIVRAPLIISVCAALVLSVPDQTREIYRLLAQDISEGTYTQSAFALVFGSMAAIFVWLIARNVTLVRATEALGSARALVTTDLRGAHPDWNGHRIVVGIDGRHARGVE